MADYAKPLPNITEDVEPFWTAAKAHTLSMPRCQDCDEVIWPLSPVCPACLGDNLEWTALSGRGVLWSWVNFHQGFNQEWAKESPYNVAHVRLEEGPIFLTNIVEAEDEALEVGMAVEVVFDDVTDEVSIPKFRPAG